MKELVVEAKVDNLAQVLDFVDEAVCHLPMKTQTQVAIAVEEIFVNIAHYAYQPGSGEAVVRVSADEDIVIEFEDGGIPYDPTDTAAPDIDASLDERQIGGLGIFMTKKMMDNVSYRREGDKNILVIKKGTGAGQ